VDRAGLIQLYATVLQRGLDLSLKATPPLAYDPNGNKGLYQALIRAAGKLSDLYLLLGHEAYADATDPTIGIGTDLRIDATSLFCFENGADIKSLLDEELALLRGRTSGGSALDHPPEFNRLKANIGDPALETAYVNNYSIRAYGTKGTDLTAEDARREYPQGHGDAWGHYLSAVKGYYQLLSATNFAWFTTNEEIVVPDLGTQVVNYNYERKFAIAAAAKSKAGAEIVNLTYRKLYNEDPAQQYQGYPDTVEPERAWGLSDWASRAGQGALFDWVTINALLPAHSTNANLERVDRETVQELAEIAANFDEIQGESDKGDSGLNPLGLAKNVVPFGGVSAAAISQGETHFEQIQRRAVGALKNAAAVFDYANQATQMLRRQDDDEAAFQQQIDERRTDYLNRLIEIFGTPYEEDPNYTDKNVPDIYNYMLIDRTSLTGEPELISKPLTIEVR